ncbi:hypothetical protein B296_00046606 [Ensete ventricosum]|uniref:Uncharacterized protein n=1 Tax=Ensete ventricosum TaxID=4639 RepID=A0A426Z3C9_ENSVE|nr:hypothetical protein B296_00046606 [Ensete ventricosum]
MRVVSYGVSFSLGSRVVSSNLGSSVGAMISGDRLVIDRVEGLYAARRAMALVLRASWLSLSSYSRAKEMAILSQGCVCNRRKMGQRCARLLRRRTTAIRSERPLLVMFNSLLAVIKTVGSEILLRLRCRQIVAKDRY